MTHMIFLKKEMGKVVPFNEEGQIVKVRKHRKVRLLSKRSVLFLIIISKMTYKCYKSIKEKRSSSIADINPLLTYV